MRSRKIFFADTLPNIPRFLCFKLSYVGATAMVLSPLWVNLVKVGSTVAIARTMMNKFGKRSGDARKNKIINMTNKYCTSAINSNS